MIRKALTAAVCLLMLPMGAWAQAGAAPTHDFMNGVDANYSLDLAGRGVVWEGGAKPSDLFALLHRNGADSFRVRVWTKDVGVNGRDYATEAVIKAQAAGLRPYLVLFLSENWSDYVKQPAPAVWQQLPFEDKLKAIEQYGHDTARHFADAGVKTDLYEIGNEIDFGICGEFEENWGNRFNLEYMRQRIWPKAAAIIRAAEKGVRKANPKARFLLHLTQWWNPDFSIAFLKTMEAEQVQADLLGLSFFPSSGLCPPNTFADLNGSIRRIHQATGKRVVLCEYAYPSMAQFGGQFASWNQPVPGYPLDPAGQAKWIADFLSFCRQHEQIAGAFYWSPEWYPEEMWQAFALFGPDGRARPGLSSLRP